MSDRKSCKRREITSTPNEFPHPDFPAFIDISLENDSGYVTPLYHSRNSNSSSSDNSGFKNRNSNTPENTVSFQPISELDESGQNSVEKSSELIRSLTTFDFSKESAGFGGLDNILKDNSSENTVNVLNNSSLDSAAKCSPQKRSNTYEWMSYRRLPCLIGREYVDFISELEERRNQPLIIQKIVSHLSSEDIYAMTKVSRVWRSVVLNTPSLKRKLHRYMKKIYATKENKHNENVSRTLFKEKGAISRTTLRQIQNIPLSSTESQTPSSPPVSPSKYRFHMFEKEGRKLEKGERLFTCPMCKFPSHVDRVRPNSVQCTNGACKYRFCLLCHCKEHTPKPCYFISTPVARNRIGVAGSSKSKKNLQRLLL